LRLSTPPRVKVLEALGAVSGGRVRVLSEREAEVDASEGQRTYRVYVDLEKRLPTATTTEQSTGVMWGTR
jgi:hypothetical protein